MDKQKKFLLKIGNASFWEVKENPVMKIALWFIKPFIEELDETEEPLHLFFGAEYRDIKTYRLIGDIKKLKGRKKIRANRFDIGSGLRSFAANRWIVNVRTDERVPNTYELEFFQNWNSPISHEFVLTKKEFYAILNKLEKETNQIKIEPRGR